MTGTLRRLKDHYGFIEPDGGAPGESIFFHCDGLRLGVSFGDLRPGTRVEFDIGIDGHSQRRLARNVRPLGEGRA